MCQAKSRPTAQQPAQTMTQPSVQPLAQPTAQQLRQQEIKRLSDRLAELQSILQAREAAATQLTRRPTGPSSDRQMSEPSAISTQPTQECHIPSYFDDDEMNPPK